MIRGAGNVSFGSTAGQISNPTTETLVAEVDSTILGSTSWRTSKKVQVTYILGSSTNAVFRGEQCLSTGLGSTAIRDVTLFYTPAAQSGQYVTTYDMEPGDRLRIRMESSLTGTVGGKIIAEILT